jgi:hypothetical protein
LWPGTSITKQWLIRRAHQLVGMQTALHQRFGFTLPHQLDCFRSRIMAVLRFLDWEARYIGFRLIGGLANTGRRPNQNRSDEAQFDRLDDTLDRDRITRMRNCGRHRQQLLGRTQEAVVSLTRFGGFCFHGVLTPD